MTSRFPPVDWPASVPLVNTLFDERECRTRLRGLDDIRRELSGDSVRDARVLQHLVQRNHRLLVDLQEAAFRYVKNIDTATSLQTLHGILFDLAQTRYNMGVFDLFRATKQLGPRGDGDGACLASESQPGEGIPTLRTGKAPGRWAYHFSRLHDKGIRNPRVSFTYPLHERDSGEVLDGYRLQGGDLIDGYSEQYHRFWTADGGVKRLAQAMQACLEDVGKRKSAYAVANALAVFCAQLDIVVSFWAMIEKEERLPNSDVPCLGFREKYKDALEATARIRVGTRARWTTYTRRRGVKRRPLNAWPANGKCTRDFYFTYY